MSRLARSTAQFNAALERFAKKVVPEQVVLLQKKVAFQVLTGVVLKTPVDTGRARGGWQLDVGAVSGAPERLDKDGSAIFADAARKLGALRFGERVAISNNVTYIIYLENGSSDQAPQGMVAITLDEVRSQFT